jgi:murein DD-endopeptidase MepM/ murein hydrolase activator NlpD
MARNFSLTGERKARKDIGGGQDVLQFAIQRFMEKQQQQPAPTTTTKVTGRASSASGRTLSAHSPVGRKAKVIGTPYKGTHTLGNWQSDNAVDIAVPVGSPMVALQDGVVVRVRHHPQNGGRFAGDQITIRGANGNEYFYAHGKASVKPGQRIRKGQKLGTTGSANGVAHLHFGQQRGDPRQHT